MQQSTTAIAQCASKIVTQQLASKKINLLGLPFIDMCTQLQSTHSTLFTKQPYKMKQIYSLMYQHGVNNIQQLPTLTKMERASLDEIYEIDYGHEVQTMKQSKSDSTIKYLLNMRDDKKIESVLMEFDGRRTMCLSSQIGCSLNCRFCKTGTQPIERNLTSAEIVGQVMLARHYLNNFPLPKCVSENRLSHLVFMGEGEPLYNYKNV
jgi:23S rRNA (adenine2503-C2)-methyltransferase